MIKKIKLIELEKIELFDGMIRCSPYLLILDIILIFHFFYTWYIRYRQSNLKLNYWHLIVFKLFVINVFLLYPFNASFENRVSVQYLVVAIDKWVDTAFLITIVGYLSFLIGGEFYKYVSKRFKFKSRFFTIERFVENNITNNFTAYLMFIIALVLIIILMSLALNSGNILNPRGVFLADPSIRPIYNLTTSLYPISVLFMGLRAMQFKGKLNISMFIILLLFSSFLGGRSAILEPLVILFFFYYLKNSSKINFVTIFSALFLLIFIALQVSSARDDGAVSNKFEEIIYGNHFSDTRDFAWLLAFFDFNCLDGNTYIAGMLTFIPRKYSEFREQWVWGVYAAKLVGITDPLFPGHRPGVFGEAFMNFNIYGVVILGFIGGIITKYIDIKIMIETLKNNNVIKMYSYTVFMLFMISFSISAVFVTLYSYLGIMIFLTCIRQLIVFVSNKISHLSIN